ncbi:MAG TPA: pilus assembly protein N-terminal domain-containing protein [Bryobacteraceae bacterium]|jgi:pilus assembly protein CpaC|nr:pilus assembly protein N-terminal domain-containing protein [Bryobacteraceae bacterium]
MRDLKQLYLVSWLLAVAAACAFAQGGPEEIRLTIGKSIVIDYPADIARISTSNADIVDASPVTGREVLVHGKSFGTVTLVVWSKAGQRNFYNITVEQNLEPLRKLLKETFPTEDIHVQSSRDSLSLTGRVGNKDVADRATALASPFAKTVVNNLQLSEAPAEKQILLRIKFAELDRSAANSFAVNLISTGATNTIGSVSTGSPAPPSLSSIGGGAPATFTISNALNIFAFRPDLNLGTLIQALEQKNLLQTLDEPTLVTTDGKEASFLVGGEFPIPVLQGGANSGAVTIQFREFGVRLTFTPNVTAHNNIRLHVKPEVSALDYTNALSFNGFTIPALSSRKMETNVELGEGQSFVIAGLIDNQVTETIAKIPGLSSLPILGNLFKSRTTNKSDTELVVLVTPEITMPLQAGEGKPGPAMPRPFLVPVTPGSSDAFPPNSKGRTK